MVFPRLLVSLVLPTVALRLQPPPLVSAADTLTLDLEVQGTTGTGILLGKDASNGP